MSKPKGYNPEVPLAVLPRSDWRRRPQLFLGPDHGSWWILLLEHFLAEVGEPGRSWTRASLRIQGHAVEWTDDCEQLLERPDLFWRDACLNFARGRLDGQYITSFSVDPLVPLPVQPSDESVLRLALRCVARSGGRSVDVFVEDRPVVTIAGSWLEYASPGGQVRSHRTVNANPFVVDVVESDVTDDGSVEVVERGVVVGRWPGLDRIVRTLAPGMRVILHSEVDLPPLQREVLTLKAIAAAISD